LLGDLVGADWKWIEYAIFNPDKEITFESLDKSVFSLGTIPSSSFFSFPFPSLLY
jgi:hypothetical protein